MMITLHPDTGFRLTRMHTEELIAEAQQFHAARQVDYLSVARRVVVATGRMLERLGERLQGTHTSPVSMPQASA